MKVIRHALKRFVETAVLNNPTISRLYQYKLAGQSVMFCKDLEDHTLVYYPHDVIGRAITDTGQYQRTPVRAIADMLRSRNRTLDDSVILELGGNIGTHTVYLCKEFPKARVLSVEADPENVDILQKNILLNDLRARAQIVAGAVSNSDGDIELTRDFFNRGGTRVGGPQSMYRGSVFSTKCMRVDTLLHQEGIDPHGIGLIWIDVEGHELEVFEGMKDLISTAKPPIYFEYTAGDAHRNSKLRNIVFETYASVWLSQSGGFVSVDRAQFDDISGTVDVLAMDV